MLPYPLATTCRRLVPPLQLRARARVLAPSSRSLGSPRALTWLPPWLLMALSPWLLMAPGLAVGANAALEPLLGMPPSFNAPAGATPRPPLIGASLHAAGKQVISNEATLADAALASALLAVKTEAMAAQEHVRTTALTWEREPTAADALARRVAEAEYYFLTAGQQLVVITGLQHVIPFVNTEASSSC